MESSLIDLEFQKLKDQAQQKKIDVRNLDM